MRELNSHERKILTTASQSLRSFVQVGQNGLTENLLAQIEQILAIHELLKVKFNDYKDEKREISESIAEETNSALVRIIGNVAIFYRPAKEAEKRKYGIII